MQDMYMNPRGLLLGLSFAALLLAGAFLLRDNFDAVVAYLHSPLQIELATPTGADPMIEQI